MHIDEAKVIFSLEGISISADELKNKYRKLMMDNHPDRGGNTDKCVDINRAYELLKQYKEAVDGLLFKTTRTLYVLGEVGDMIEIYSGKNVRDINGQNVDLDILVSEDVYVMFNGSIEYNGVYEPFSRLIKKNKRDIYSIELEINNSYFCESVRLSLHNKQIDMQTPHRNISTIIRLDKNITVNFSMTVINN